MFGQALGKPQRMDLSLFMQRGLMVKLFSALICFFLVSLAGAETAVRAEAVSAATVTAGPGTREAAAIGETTEMHLPKDRAFTPWLLDPSIFAEDQGDRTEKRRVAEKDVKTIKLQNLVPPIHFASGEAEIPVGYVQRLRDVLGQHARTEQRPAAFRGTHGQRAAVRRSETKVRR